MPTLPPIFRPRGLSSRQRQRESDRARGSVRSRGCSRTWDKATKQHLAAHPICAYCALDGIATAASLVDHLFPHHGDQAVFWQREPWISSCADCHNGMKQSLERQGMAALIALTARLGLAPS